MFGLVPCPRRSGYSCGFVRVWSDRLGDSNLMAPDEFKNLGFAEEEGRGEAIPAHAGGATKLRVRDDGKKIS